MKKTKQNGDIKSMQYEKLREIKKSKVIKIRKVIVTKLISN